MTILAMNQSFMVIEIREDDKYLLWLIDLERGQIVQNKILPTDYRVHIYDDYLVFISMLKQVELIPLSDERSSSDEKSIFFHGNYIDALLTDNYLIMIENNGYIVSKAL